MEKLFLSLFILLAAASSARADVIVTDDAVVVQSDRAASRDDDKKDENVNQPIPNGSGPTVITPDGDIEINNQRGGQVLNNNEISDRRGDVIIVPDRN